MHKFDFSNNQRNWARDEILNFFDVDEVFLQYKYFINFKSALVKLGKIYKEKHLAEIIVEFVSIIILYKSLMLYI